MKAWLTIFFYFFLLEELLSLTLNHFIFLSEKKIFVVFYFSTLWSTINKH